MQLFYFTIKNTRVEPQKKAVESKERMYDDGVTHRESVHNTERLQQLGKETVYIATQKWWQQGKDGGGSLVPRLLPSLLLHTVCNKKLRRSLEMRFY